MSDNSRIEWTDATIVDRGGRRVRAYVRRDPSRPGQQQRRQMRARGLAWCRGCRAWLPLGAVSQGACRSCLNVEYRANYAARPHAIRARSIARRRGIDPLPVMGADYLLEQFGGRCAYCPAAANTWDHVVPVSAGGRTEPGNIVPACGSCNSSKGNREVASWLRRTHRTPHYVFFDVIALGGIAA